MKINLGPFSFDAEEILNSVQRLHRSLNGKTGIFSNYFKIVGNPDMDYCVYQLGLRPLIPLMDLTYLEYLHYLMEKNQIQKLLIFPTVDLSSPRQDMEGYNLLSHNCQMIFGRHAQNMELIDPFEQSSNLSSVPLLSTDFLESIQYLSNEGFLKYVRNQLGLNIHDYTDFNRFHPEELKLVSIYVHSVRCYIIWKYLQSIGAICNGAPTILGFVLWETEVDKLAMFHKLALQHQEISITAILGESVMIDRKTPIPVYDESDSLNIFDDDLIMARKLSKRSNAELKVYEDILTTIIQQNYGLPIPENYSEIENFVVGLSLNFEVLDNPNLNKRASRVLYYMVNLRKLYSEHEQ